VWEVSNYILNDAGDPVPEPDILKWAMWFQTGARIVGHAVLHGDVTVSTVFLGADHSFVGGAPLLFETMVFGGPLDETQERYPTRAAALAGHDRWVKAAQDATS
jgi:hypothetical protein